MAQATSSRGGSSKTQVQAESIPPEESQIGNPEVSSREKRRHRASLARHSRKCSVCHHPDRQFIDDDYLRWISPKKIARQYKIHHSAVYRHADATGLRTQRRASLRATLEHFIEQAEDVRVTAHSIVSAVRLCAQINDQGQYNPTARRHIIEHHYVGLPAADGLPAEAGDPESASPAATAANARASTAPAATAPRADRADPVEKSDGSPSHTSASRSAAPPAKAQKDSHLLHAADVASAATSAATSAAPLGESPKQFPAVSVAAAPAPTKSKTTATPIATIYLQTNAISNRELLGLDHVATH